MDACQPFERDVVCIFRYETKEIASEVGFEGKRIGDFFVIFLMVL